MVHSISPRRKGWSMSIFSVGGNIGFALGPIVAAGIALIGLHWTPIVLIPGVIICGLLARYAPNPKAAAQTFDLGEVRAAFARAGRSLALIVSVIAIRSGTQFALIIFLPLYYHARGFPVQLGSYYAFVFSLAGAAGGLAGGELSDRYGRKIVVVCSLALTTPLLILALLSGGILIWPLLALSGAALLASNSVTVVQGQELLPGSTGIASGLTLGLGFGLSGVITSILANLSPHIGLTAVVAIVPFLPLLAAALAVFVPATHRVVGVTSIASPAGE
jgi:FSR family fosmidomycin resistance protein-like MFS transporter